MTKKPKTPPSMDQRIKDMLQEGPLVALYLLAGINLLKTHTDSLTDDEVRKMFDNLIHPDRVRQNVTTIYNKLNFPHQKDNNNT